MNEKKCKDCKYFLQHYGLNGGKLFRIYCGHCTFSRTRRKHPDTKSCENFTPGPADTDAFVSKDYLSKELLKFVLSMELLPEIDGETL